MAFVHGYALAKIDMFSDLIEKLNRFHLAPVDQVCNCFIKTIADLVHGCSGVSLVLKVEGALKKVGGRASSADCYGGCRCQWWTFCHLAQEYCAKSADR